MADGEVVVIGRRQFLVGEVIGEGAYARVWAARGASQEEAAIKEMRCGQGPGILPDASLQRAMFEVEVMVRLAASEENQSIGVGARPVEVAAPRVLEHQFWQLGPSTPNAYLCRVAMTRRPGRPLGTWLEARAARKAVLGTPLRGAPDGIDEVSTYCGSFLGAIRVTRAMLSQLSPTLERLNGSIAIHRDVNARNLLVHSPSDNDVEEGAAAPGAAPLDVSSLEFSIVDFGSSTDARAWLGTGEGSWSVENPTGDARYWGPANWVRFLGGPQALAQEPGLLRIYSRRLDMFALAICAMQVLLELHTAEQPSEAALQAMGSSGTLEGRLVQSMQQVRAAWANYWAMAVRSFDRLAEYSRQVCLGEQQLAAQHWQELSGGGIPQQLGQKLHELCRELQVLAELCHLQQQRGGGLGAIMAAGAPTSAAVWGQAGHTLGVLRDMAHDDSAIEWTELTARVGPPILRRHLDEARAAAAAAAAAANSTGSSVESEAGVAANTAPVPVAAGGSAAVMLPTGSSVTAQAGGPSPGPVPGTGGGASIATSAAPGVVSMPAGVAPAAATGGVLALNALGPPRLIPNRGAPAAAVAPPATGSMGPPAVLPQEGKVLVEVLVDSPAAPGGPPLRTAPPQSVTAPAVSIAPASTGVQALLTPPVPPQPSLLEGNAGEEREHEALRILRQVESEVQTLKRWYTEAIEAMRSPPFPAWGSTPQPPPPQVP